MRTAIITALTLAATLPAGHAWAQRAYLVAEIAPSDNATYMREYGEKVAPVVTAHGGRYIARSPSGEAIEGSPPGGRVSIIEFPDMAAARKTLESPEYQALVPVRKRLTKSVRIFLVEGMPTTP